MKNGNASRGGVGGGDTKKKHRYRYVGFWVVFFYFLIIMRIKMVNAGVCVVQWKEYSM